LRSTNPRVSFTVFGETSPAACSNQASTSSPAVALVRTDRPCSASVTISARTRWAARLPPRTVRVAWRCLPVTGSRPTYTRSSQLAPRWRMNPFMAFLQSIHLARHWHHGVRTRRGTPESASDLGFLGSPYGIRTRAATLRGWCPRPLDERAVLPGAGAPCGASRYQREHPSSWGERNRTPNNRTRICCVASYTTPHWSDRAVYRRPSECGAAPCRTVVHSGAVEHSGGVRSEVLEADDAAESDTGGLDDVAAH
jgi:hypothetical protein